MRCRVCGFDNAEVASHCGLCGADLSPQAVGPATPAAVPHVERRLVSILFADLVGFTPLAESLDVEEVRAIQQRYFETARAIVSRHGGTLEKFVGDAVMAMWGAPAAHEDDARRAVLAGLELVGAVGRLGGAGADRSLTARAAVMTGEAAVTIGAQGQGLVSGDLVNTAARLQSVAPPGGVLVNDAARRSATGIAFESAGHVALRGKSDELAAWRASTVMVGAERGGGRIHAGRFVGRQAPLNQVIASFERVERDRRGELVTIVGQGGIGKSRLLWEFSEHVERLPRDVMWHIGRVPAYGDSISFAPLAEMVRGRVRVREGEDIEVATRQLAGTLAELVKSREARAWIEPRLTVLIDPSQGGRYERDELFAAWRQFFEHISQFGTTVLVFEDLHWADSSLLDFVEELSVWTREHPILVLVATRPELLERRPGWGASVVGSSVISLERLSNDAISELLTGLMAGIDSTTTSRLLERSGGVPLYAVELARLLADERQPAESAAGSAHRPERMDSVGLPDTLRGLITARIDLLPPEERSLLLAGAVLGSRFHSEALAAIGGERPATFRPRLDALIRRDLLTVDEDPASPGLGQLAFVQDVVREVAGGILSRAERRVLHLAAADHLEVVGDEELVEAIADHLLAAHHLIPSISSDTEMPARTVDALERAARRAMNLHAPERALAYLIEALPFATEALKRGKLLEAAGAAARAATQFELAERYLVELVELHSGAAGHGEELRARAQLASLLLIVQRNEPALAQLAEAVEAIGEMDESSVHLAGQLARAKVIVGADAEALEWSDRTIAAAERLGQAAVALDARITRGTARVHLGGEREGLGELDAAVKVAAAQHLVGSELRARNNLAWLTVTDDPHVTLETARAGAELATTMGLGDDALQLTGVAVTAAVETGDWAWALDALSRVASHRTPAPSHRIDFAVAETIITALSGGDGAGVLDRLGPLDPDTDRQLLAAIDYGRAWVAFSLGDFRASRAWADAAVARSLAAERFHSQVLNARACIWMEDADGADQASTAVEALRIRGRAAEAAGQTVAAGSAALAGRMSDSRTGYRSAAQRWRELRLPLPLGICLLEQARFARDESGLDEARQVLGALGAEPLLRRTREKVTHRSAPA